MRIASWLFPVLLVLVLATVLNGCVVLAVVDTAGTIAAKTAGVAADAAIGTVKVAGKVVGKAADAAIGSDKDPAK